MFRRRCLCIAKSLSYHSREHDGCTSLQPVAKQVLVFGPTSTYPAKQVKLTVSRNWNDQPCRSPPVVGDPGSPQLLADKKQTWKVIPSVAPSVNSLSTAISLKGEKSSQKMFLALVVTTLLSCSAQKVAFVLQTCSANNFLIKQSCALRGYVVLN